MSRRSWSDGYDAFGKLQLSNSFNCHSARQVVNISSLATGLYFVSVAINNNAGLFSKLVIAK